MDGKEEEVTFICCKKSQEPFMRGSLGGEDKISSYEKLASNMVSYVISDENA